MPAATRRASACHAGLVVRRRFMMATSWAVSAVGEVGDTRVVTDRIALAGRAATIAFMAQVSRHSRPPPGA
jgi:hypothetical protein